MAYSDRGDCMLHVGRIHSECSQGFAPPLMVGLH